MFLRTHGAGTHQETKKIISPCSTCGREFPNDADRNRQRAHQIDCKKLWGRGRKTILQCETQGRDNSIRGKYNSNYTKSIMSRTAHYITYIQGGSRSEENDIPMRAASSRISGARTRRISGNPKRWKCERCNYKVKPQDKGNIIQYALNTN